MEKMNVTAVVVTYNRKALLEKVIRSLLAQTVEIGRIIIVNNGSTDGTGEWLAAEYGNDPRFDVVTQENVGGSGGFYRGIQEASKESATGYGVWTTMCSPVRTAWKLCSM